MTWQGDTKLINKMTEIMTSIDKNVKYTMKLGGFKFKQKTK